jgi:lysyl-tRNA synthetase class 2
MLRAVRSFFAARAFLEVETPVRLHAPLPERHIDAVPADGLWLATSAEPHMKQLLAAGCERIMQISKCFRRGEAGTRHHPEFTMLEWYRTHADYRVLADDARALLCDVSTAVCGDTTVVYQQTRIDLAAPWEWLSVDEAYQRYAEWRLEDQPESFAFDCTMTQTIEPRLGIGRPTVLYDYPACFCPMAEPLAHNAARAARLEIYLAGLELANGCTERRDAHAQRQTLREEQAARQAMGKDVYPWPDAFDAALERMPAAAGMALGLDRLAMVLCDTTSIEDVIAFCEPT